MCRGSIRSWLLFCHVPLLRTGLTTQGGVRSVVLPFICARQVVTDEETERTCDTRDAGALFGHGTISGAVYADRMGGSSDTIGAAVAEAERMPDTTAAPLLDAAFDAFAQGFSLAATVGGILAAVVAVVAAFTLRKLPVSAERHEETDDI
ncbi:MAG TPA: hypothetical protein H9751_01070 [Candidatus Corynebacterium faecigallinarum]|uniref:MFS transporter n=1 Tax=Candidatus Corynebacterium faecigallinarum TaxID=2838528 RepID=A0A9D2TMT3_9CORY|nr:hypothetical protein [Candidatus Corynebacterium faecigallinarum]